MNNIMKLEEYIVPIEKFSTNLVVNERIRRWQVANNGKIELSSESESRLNVFANYVIKKESDKEQEQRLAMIHAYLNSNSRLGDQEKIFLDSMNKISNPEKISELPEFDKLNDRAKNKIQSLIKNKIVSVPTTNFAQSNSATTSAEFNSDSNPLMTSKEFYKYRELAAKKDIDAYEKKYRVSDNLVRQEIRKFYGLDNNYYSVLFDVYLNMMFKGLGSLINSFLQFIGL